MYGVKAIKKLQQKKYRQEFGCFLVEGKRAVTDALNSQAQVIQLIMSDRFVREEQDFCHQASVKVFFQNNKVLEVSEAVFGHMVDTVTPQGIAAVVQLPANTLAAFENAKLIAVLEDVRDPGNLGTMIRTADWFGIDGLLLIGGADPYQPKVVRASMGSLFHVPLLISQQVTQELSHLKDQGFSLVVTRPELAEGQATSFVTADKVCVVFGNEAEGTSTRLDALADQSWSIPKFGAAESLNVAVSFGIAMYELRQQLSIVEV